MVADIGSGIYIYILSTQDSGLSDAQKYGAETETDMHGPLACAKTPKLCFRVGDLDLPERRNRFVIHQ